MNNEPSSIVRELSWTQSQLLRFKYWFIRLRRRFPYIVWYGDELDVTITFADDCLDACSIEDAEDQFKSGAFSEMQTTLNRLGISFDTGMGGWGRDWEWDWSLEGPISVQFRGRASRPEKRRARPKLKLVHGKDRKW